MAKPTKLTGHARLMQSAAHKLEVHKSAFALTKPEFKAAQELVDHAVEFVNEYCCLHPRAKQMPRSVLWRGERYRLEYTTLGRLAVLVNGSKARFYSAPLAL